MAPAVPTVLSVMKVVSGMASVSVPDPHSMMCHMI
jgi:hypothetical protein